MEIFHGFACMFSMSSAAVLLYVRKAKNDCVIYEKCWKHCNKRWNCHNVFKSCLLHICLSMWEQVNPFRHVDAFWRNCRRRILKKSWQKEKYQCIIEEAPILAKTLTLSLIQTLSGASAADHDEQFLLLPQYFQLFSVIKPTFIELFCVFAYILSKPSAANLLYVGKG